MINVFDGGIIQKSLNTYLILTFKSKPGFTLFRLTLFIYVVDGGICIIEHFVHDLSLLIAFIAIVILITHIFEVIPSILSVKLILVEMLIMVI